MYTCIYIYTPIIHIPTIRVQALRSCMPINMIANH